MKDSEFIELLNLYLDHEISAADAARLEAEVQRNPERRRVYRQYCQMQKACKVLTTDFQTEPAAAPERKVVDFHTASQRHQRSSAFYTLGALTAAAACIAIVVIGRNREPAGVDATSAAIAQRAPAVAPTIARTATAAPLRAEGPPATLLVNDSLSLADHVQAQARAASSGDATAQFAWMHEFRIAPIQAQVTSTGGTHNLEARPALLQKTESTTYNSDRPMDPNVTPMVIRFQK